MPYLLFLFLIDYIDRRTAAYDQDGQAHQAQPEAQVTAVPGLGGAAVIGFYGEFHIHRRPGKNWSSGSGAVGGET